MRRGNHMDHQNNTIQYEPEYEYFSTDLKTGKMLHVHTFDECIAILNHRYNRMKENLYHANQEIKKLLSEHYKDEEITRLKKRIEELEATPEYGFQISAKQYEQIREWMVQHDLEKHNCSKNKRHNLDGAIGGRYTYSFVPTTIGTIGSVQCSCGDKFTFMERD